MEVVIKVVEPVLVAALRHVGSYHEADSAWESLFGLLCPAGLCAEEATAYGVCYDNPDITPVEQCRMDVCLTLPKGVDQNAPEVAKLVASSKIFTQFIGNGGEYASVLIKGPYTLLHPAYCSLFSEWLPKSGREHAGSAGFEAYYNDPNKTPPEELLTEIFVPLKPLV